MKQYCRYCAFCHTDFDWYYCTEHETEMTEKRIKRPSKCHEFALSEMGDVISGKQYSPRKPKEAEECGFEQLSLLTMIK